MVQPNTHGSCLTGWLLTNGIATITSTAHGIVPILVEGCAVQEGLPAQHNVHTLPAPSNLDAILHICSISGYEHNPWQAHNFSHQPLPAMQHYAGSKAHSTNLHTCHISTTSADCSACCQKRHARHYLRSTNPGVI
jgi:hypothetical protein